MVCSKKFLIEELDGTKVVGRRKGITTTACTSAVAVFQETQDFQFLSLGDKARLGGSRNCAKAQIETEVCNKSAELTMLCPTS